MEFYHDLITQQSWEELKRLKRVLGDFVLIGGWAVFLYTRSLKSKDIDIIVSFDQLPELEKAYQLYKTNRLKKYEAVKGPVQIDVYLPHYSEIGLPLENILNEIRLIEGYSVLDPNYLFVLKLITLKSRGRSPKGRKDFVDLLSLYVSGVVETRVVRSIIVKFGLKGVLEGLQEFVEENTELRELGINKHSYSKVKKQLQVEMLN